MAHPPPPQQPPVSPGTVAAVAVAVRSRTTAAAAEGKRRTSSVGSSACAVSATSRDRILGRIVAAAGSERPAPPPGPYIGSTTSLSTSLTRHGASNATLCRHCLNMRWYPPSTTHSTAPWHAAAMTSPGCPAKARRWMPRVASNVWRSSTRPSYMNPRCRSLEPGNPAVPPQMARRGTPCSLARCTANSRASLWRARCADCTQRRT
mmetsp:Transcript_36424/g.90826  ORF Transcript_36424/g.90826 Transcript_36424/m.90826 type:complete len:206 (-) Transcript_36424:844-1461(-)